MNIFRGALGLLLVLPLVPLLAEDAKRPYPEGKSTQTHAGLAFELEIPVDYDPEESHALIVGLHGMGSTGKEFATWLDRLVADEFVVCAPKSTGTTWNKADVEKVKSIVRHLVETLSIDPSRLHATGFSNGGAHLGFLVFDPKLPFATACWMGSGFGGGKVPRGARKTMAAMALCGARDAAFGAARGTVDRLRNKVRRVEFHSEPELAHEIPRGLMPYYYYWISVMEGRFEPGEDAFFDWHFGMESATTRMKDEKRAAFLFFYSSGDGENANAKHLEHVVFFDERVRHFGLQLVPIQLQKEHQPEVFASMGLTTTPAVVVLKRDGSIAKRFEGRIEAKALARALRAYAKNKAMPR